MSILKKLLLFLMFQVAVQVSAQDFAALDSMKAGFAAAKTAEMQVYWLDLLSRTSMNVNLNQSEEYGKKIIFVAEESRDRKLMVKAYMSNGLRCSYFGVQKSYLHRSIEYYDKALEIARQNKLQDEIGAVQLRLASVFLTIPEKDKALNYVNQAFSVISTLSNDSLRSEAYNSFGHVYLARNDKILALRNYLTALRIAEKTKNNELIRNCYLYLSSFYAGIEEYDKAIDYHTLALKKLEVSNEKGSAYQRAIDFNSIGNLYARKKNHEIAISYFNRSIALADSLKFSTLKLPGYVSLLNEYLRMDEPQKALDYLNSSEGMELQKFLVNFGLAPVVDQSFAVVMTETGKYDSARMHFAKALPYYEQKTSEANKMGFYGQLAHFYRKTGENEKAIEYFLKVKEMGDKMGSLEHVRSASRQLDSLYTKTGNLKLANQYGSIYYVYKDSIEKLNKEKELAQVEAADEQQRDLLLKQEEAEAKRKKYSIQYMAITIGIALMFIVMVMMGLFRVSAATIRIISFFAFLLFFEFIFLIFKKNIYGITHGEPWKDLAFVIALAAMLVPLHHWLEHKVIHFLTSHHMLKFRSMFSKKEIVSDELV